MKSEVCTLTNLKRLTAYPYPLCEVGIMINHAAPEKEVLLDRLFVCFSFGVTLSMTYGMLNVICASSTVVNPSENCGKSILPAINNSIREIPVTISAFNIGILVIPIITVRNFAFNA